MLLLLLRTREPASRDKRKSGVSSSQPARQPFKPSWGRAGIQIAGGIHRALTKRSCPLRIDMLPTTDRDDADGTNHCCRFCESRRSNSSRASRNSCMAAANRASSSVDGCAPPLPSKCSSSAADAACTSRAAPAMRSSATASGEALISAITLWLPARLIPQIHG